MKFIDHTIAWCTGELFEARIILIVGVLLAISASAFWILGNTPFAKAAIWPALVLSVIIISMGVTLTISNNSRIKKFTEAYNENPVAFIDSEKKRTDDFIRWYPKTRWIFFGVGVAGMLLVIYGNALWKSIGLVLMSAALFTFVVDHFSEERALEYAKHISNAGANTSLP